MNNIVNPDDEVRGVIGSMPTFFWGEMYANFGYLGILIPPFFIGYTVYAFNTLIFRLPMSPLMLAIFVSVIDYIKKISGTGLGDYILNIQGIIIVIFTLISRGFFRDEVIKLRKKDLT